MNLSRDMSLKPWENQKGIKKERKKEPFKVR